MLHLRPRPSLRPHPSGRGVAAASLLALAIALTGAGGALAAPATSITQHFSVVQQWGTPQGPTTSPSNCPAPVLNDFVWIDATGNGVMHQTVNGAGDFWATSTFTGQATITAYPASSLTDIGTDANGNTTATIVGPSELTVSGHLTEWFGVSANMKNGVIHGTVNFTGTDVATGAPLSLHSVFHAAWLPGTDLNGPPSFYFDRATC